MDCRYCGKPAGFMRRQHAECRRRHDVATAKIQELFGGGLQSPMNGDQIHKLADQEAAQNFIPEAEREELVSRGMSAMINSAIVDRGLSDADDKRISEFQNSFKLSLNALGGDGLALAKARILRALDAGTPVQVAVDGPYAPRLEAGEHALWCFTSVSYLTFRTRTRYVGGSAGMSIRIVRGVYYHGSAFHGEPIKTEYLNTEDSGCLTITMHNVYFVGHHHALKFPLRKIASAHLYQDGIEILQNGVTAKPAIFILDDPRFAANLIARLPADNSSAGAHATT